MSHVRSFGNGWSSIFTDWEIDLTNFGPNDDLQYSKLGSMQILYGIFALFLILSRLSFKL